MNTWICNRARPGERDPDPEAGARAREPRFVSVAEGGPFELLSNLPLARSGSVRLVVSARRRIRPEESSHRAFCRQPDLPLTWRTCSHLKEQGFKNLSLEQCAQLIGGKSGVVATQSSRCHACGHEC